MTEHIEEAREAERKRAVAAIHWVFSADGTKSERSMADEAIHKINDLSFMPISLRSERKEREEGDPTWRDLALQFDGHRIESLSMLRYVSEAKYAAEVVSRASEIKAFLSKPPLSGEEVLAQRIAAASPPPASPAVTVGVKGLEWVDNGNAWNAPGYRIERGDNGQFYVRSNEASGLFGTIEFAGTLSAAKAAAQSDYETRVLSALTSPAGETAQVEAGSHGIRICPERDAPCPHGMACPFNGDRYNCDLVRSRSALSASSLSGKEVETAQTYYTDGKDAGWFEALPTGKLAWELTKAAQDIADGDFACIEDWMPVSAMLSIAGDRLALSAKESPEQLRATHRHVKRGSEYVLIGYGKMQTEHWRDPNLDADYDNQAVDMREIAIYSSVDDGSLWVRPREEFEDGRFEPLPASPARGEGT